MKKLISIQSLILFIFLPCLFRVSSAQAEQASAGEKNSLRDEHSIFLPVTASSSTMRLNMFGSQNINMNFTIDNNVEISAPPTLNQAFSLGFYGYITDEIMLNMFFMSYTNIADEYSSNISSTPNLEEGCFLNIMHEFNKNCHIDIGYTLIPFGFFYYKYLSGNYYLGGFPGASIPPGHFGVSFYDEYRINNDIALDFSTGIYEHFSSGLRLGMDYKKALHIITSVFCYDLLSGNDFNFQIGADFHPNDVFRIRGDFYTFSNYRNGNGTDFDLLINLFFLKRICLIHDMYTSTTYSDRYAFYLGLHSPIKSKVQGNSSFFVGPGYDFISNSILILCYFSF